MACKLYTWVTLDLLVVGVLLLCGCVASLKRGEHPRVLYSVNAVQIHHHEVDCFFQLVGLR